MEDNSSIAVILIIVCIVIIASLVSAFFLGGKYIERKQANELALQQEGYQRAVIDIFQIVSNCRTYPININNVTVTLAALECIPQGG